MSSNIYPGQELTLFSKAINWKKYYTKLIRPYFGSRVLEVGAGLGATTMVMCTGEQREWLCLEPDSYLCSEIDTLILSGQLPQCCRTRCSFVLDLPLEAKFDTIIYIDVLEHIKDDIVEISHAAKHLVPGGILIILSPANMFLFSPFDDAIGHYRRYTKSIFRMLAPEDLRIIKLIYLDSVGMLTSLVNRLVLKQRNPTLEQIMLWDRKLIPISRFLDPITGNRIGRSILGIWKHK